MALVTHIKVQNVRVHKVYKLEVLPSTTIITGANGSGKTTLIEALYIALLGSSFKGGDSDVLKTGAPWYRIDVQFNDGSQRTVKFDPARTAGKKKFEIEGSTHYRLLPKYRYPVVLFEPDDLRLLHGSPSRRRDYFDHFISQLDPLYGAALRKYERALKQRNNLLKHSTLSPDELFVWDVALSEHGAYICKQRVWYISLLQGQLHAVHAKISGTHDKVSVEYSARSITKQKLLTELHMSAKKDMLSGFTSVGPHRHDILFGYNGSSALSVASRGEVRSMMLALKFIEVDVLEHTFNRKPIILLDDVFSELDATRQKHLTENFKNNQVIITSATSHAGSGHEIR